MPPGAVERTTAHRSPAVKRTQARFRMVAELVTGRPVTASAGGLHSSSGG